MSAVNIFIRMGTQWVVGGMGGVIGLNYVALPIVAPLEVNSERWPDTLDDIRKLEETALETMRLHNG